MLVLLASSPGLRISGSKVAPLWHIGRVSYNLENLENLELSGNLKMALENLEISGNFGKTNKNHGKLPLDESWSKILDLWCCQQGMIIILN